MSEFFTQYGLFLAELLTLIVGILLLVAGVGNLVSRRREGQRDGHIEVKNLNERLEDMKNCIESAVFDEQTLKQMDKDDRKKEKAEAKARKKALKQGRAVNDDDRNRIYVIDFDGDVAASQVDALREEITAVLTMARPADEVVLRLESPGGMVHGYGLAASQLERIRRRSLHLTICVDKVAASGGYMMACIGERILSAPFALVGSIGVVAQMPNFHRLLQKYDVDYDVYTAGEYKRTVTVFGENTEKGREKFKEELEDTHELFKQFVSEYRPSLDIDKIATGEAWFGRRAKENGLIDDIKTSDDYLYEKCETHDVYQVSYQVRKNLQDRLGAVSCNIVERAFSRMMQKLYETRFLNR